MVSKMQNELSPRGAVCLHENTERRKEGTRFEAYFPNRRPSSQTGESQGAGTAGGARTVGGNTLDEARNEVSKPTSRRSLQGIMLSFLHPSSAILLFRLSVQIAMVSDFWKNT